MYQIITQTWINGERKPDSVGQKFYKKKGFAERKAKELATDIITMKGHHIVTKHYVRKELCPVTEEFAKIMYCKSCNVYVDGEYGIELLTPSGWYGSHAPALELFYRGANHCRGYYKEYDGEYYVECDDILLREDI